MLKVEFPLCRISWLKCSRALEMFCECSQQETVCFGLDAGPRGRVSSTQGEASTFTVLREVLAFRDLFVYIKDDSYNSWSLVTSVSFHAVFTGRIELNRLMISLNLPLTIWLLGLSFGMKSLSYDFRFWVIRQIACVIVTWRSMNKSWIVVFSR